MADVTLKLETTVKKMKVSSGRVLRRDWGASDRAVIAAIAGGLLNDGQRFVVFKHGDLCDYIFELAPELKRSVASVLTMPDEEAEAGRLSLPDGVKTVFLAATRWQEIHKMKNLLPSGLKTMTLDVIKEIAPALVPASAWVPLVESIYPIDIPEINFKVGMDVILIDLPARSLGQMPVGFGYVHDALKKEPVKLQTVDLDIIIYHRYHSTRILDGIPVMKTPSGAPMPDDPWLPVHYLEWEKPDFIEYFRPEINEIADKIAGARPRILGCSLQQANLLFAREVVARVKQLHPDVIIVVGGMSCLQSGAAKGLFPLADYTVVGEADLTIGPLVKLILAGEKPRDMAGIWSRCDAQDRCFTPARPPEDLDALGHPRYEWTDLGLYRNWNGYALVPIVGSRGCSWSKCRFCAERFNWRIRTPEKVVDDIEFFHSKGFEEFVFNESDLHGNPKIIDRLCAEIIRRKLKVRMTAQLRCDKRADRPYYDKLSEAGFVCLRFGVDAGSENTLRLQLKGTTKEIIRRNLRDATEAGIYTEINIVVGIPGETEADIDETIEFIVGMKQWIGRVAFINALMLFRGSEYWEDPEAFGIRFNTPKDELYRRFPVAIPDWAWYSENPAIVAQTRYDRYRRVATALKANGVRIGDWAEFTTSEVSKKGADLASMHNAMAALDDADIKTSSDEAQGAMPVDPNQPVFMYSYRGFNLVRYLGFVYAFPQSAGAIDFSSEQSRTSTGAIIAESEAHSKRLIDWTFSVPSASAYHVVQYDGMFLGIETGCKALVREITHTPGMRAGAPRLIASCVDKGYNLVSYDDFVYAAPVSLGPLDLTRKEHRERPGIIHALNESTARALIESVARGASPALLESYKGYNLVGFEHKVYAVPITLGHLDLRDEAARAMPGILAATGRVEARALIEATLTPHAGAAGFWGMFE
ncbi:MAG: radical SAM protein [Deltaproteobacteria bacterium]